jgi:ATP/maltotriose-dependent transcriptional regulator MalT
MKLRNKNHSNESSSPTRSRRIKKLRSIQKINIAELSKNQNLVITLGIKDISEAEFIGLLLENNKLARKYLSDIWFTCYDPDSSKSEGIIDSNPDHAKSIAFTCRQYDILYNIKKGLRNKEIAPVLNINENTVKSHLSVLFPRIGVKKRAGARRFFERLAEGVLEIPSERV